MIVRALDGDGDWTLGRGKSDYLTGNRAIGQLINTRLNSFLGDCFFDTTSGIDWFNLNGGKNKLAIDAAVRTCILNTPGVTGLVELSVVLDQNRNIRIQYNVLTIYPGLYIGSNDLLLDELGNPLTDENGDPLHA